MMRMVKDEIGWITLIIDAGNREVTKVDCRGQVGWVSVRWLVSLLGVIVGR